MELYLITGFLGAGKTTLVEHLIGMLTAQRLCVIVNEFGKAGIDGDRLARLGVAVSQIENGSIFCACRIDQFESALRTAMQSAPDVILVEASGLSDPGNMETVLAQQPFNAITYRGSICLADALRFPKALQGVRACREQVAASRLVLLNKADMATPEQLQQVEALVREIAPQAAVHPTVYAKIQPQWLNVSPAGAARPRLQRKDLGLVRRFIRLHPLPDTAALTALLSSFAPASYRIKGYALCAGQPYLADCVGDTVELKQEALPEGAELGINVLAGPGLPLEKTLAKTLRTYPQWIAAVEK